MRNTLISALMITCLALSGCGSAKQQQLNAARERIAGASELSLTAEVRADYGETAERYTLEYSFDGTTWTATVTAPSSVGGVIARMTDHGSEIEYDGAILTAGNLLNNGVTPIGTVPMLFETLTEGTVDSVWTEGDLLVGKLVYDDELNVTVWFSDGVPMGAELTENGIVKAVCTLTNVQIKETTQDETTETENLGGDPPGESGR